MCRMKAAFMYLLLIFALAHCGGGGGGGGSDHAKAETVDFGDMQFDIAAREGSKVDTVQGTYNGHAVRVTNLVGYSGTIVSVNGAVSSQFQTNTVEAASNHDFSFFPSYGYYEYQGEIFPFAGYVVDPEHWDIRPETGNRQLSQMSWSGIHYGYYANKATDDTIYQASGDNGKINLTPGSSKWSAVFDPSSNFEEARMVRLENGVVNGVNVTGILVYENVIGEFRGIDASTGNNQTLTTGVFSGRNETGVFVSGAWSSEGPVDLKRQP